jgi:hypothetical protein
MKDTTKQWITYLVLVGGIVGHFYSYCNSVDAIAGKNIWFKKREYHQLYNATGLREY